MVGSVEVYGLFGYPDYSDDLFGYWSISLSGKNNSQRKLAYVNVTA